jgi:hypothetical protein
MNDSHGDTRKQVLLTNKMQRRKDVDHRQVFLSFPVIISMNEFYRLTRQYLFKLKKKEFFFIRSFVLFIYVISIMVF